ncbi:conserved hypothetical protein [Paraburkholderia unamae]|uniref:HEAT repeat domain-containing protein n=1 Tax=Paraburkholderia unamae TaxID=219649 RepID=UPI001CABBF21|nr:HEAT repeat domain-containing protein [Paraburkholderia unamae]CAG9260923.1 conserved hypothetical protein [Paraburkholderia unamae]
MSTSDDAIFTLTRTINDTSMDVDIRAAAAEGLGFAGGREARRILIEVLGDYRAGAAIRVAAARALGHAANR